MVKKLLVQRQRCLAVITDSGITWTPHMALLKKKLLAFIRLACFISGITWGATVSPLLRLYQAPLVYILSYRLPIIRGTCKTNINTLQTLESRALRACLGLPRSTTRNGTIAETDQLPIVPLQE